MALLLADDIEMAFGDRRILTGARIRVDPKERVGLVGVNGGGKSTLLKIMAGVLEPDHGRVVCEARISLLDQDPEFVGETVEDVVRLAVAWHDTLLADWETALTEGDNDRAEVLQTELEQVGWTVDHRIDAVLDKLKTPPRDTPTATLSGGERRRVALAKVLLEAPEVLLLDEPTNHLDAEITEWLESWLRGYRGAVVMVTHDRYLLEAVADRIVEVEGGLTISYDGAYTDYLIASAERQVRTARDRVQALAVIAREAIWASRSPSARRTKQKARLGRIDELKASVPTLHKRDYAFHFKTGVPKGSTLIELHGVSKGYGGPPLFEDLDLVVRPGDRIGILGSNGAGKSTLLSLIRATQTPDTGEVLRGPRLRLGVLDQARTGLDDDQTVIEAAGDGRHQLELHGREIHVASFLERFAFPRPMFEQHVGGLSGGERARLLIAKLMLEGANLLLLDEPTNDLDLLTLRTLEEALLGFDGGVVVVTHDRAFLDRVCTRVLAFEGQGKVVAYASRMQHVAAVAERKQNPAASPPPAKPKAPPTRPAPRMTHAEKKELAALEAQIETLEAELVRVEAILADASTYRDRADDVPALTARCTALPEQIEGLYSRWEVLSTRAPG